MPCKDCTQWERIGETKDGYCKSPWVGDATPPDYLKSTRSVQKYLRSKEWMDKTIEDFTDCKFYDPGFDIE